MDKKTLFWARDNLSGVIYVIFKILPIFTEVYFNHFQFIVFFYILIN